MRAAVTRRRPCRAGLNGYVEYPTQQLNSGLAPLSELSAVAPGSRTVCLKPGQFLDGANPALIKDQLVRVARCAARRAAGSTLPLPAAALLLLQLHTQRPLAAAPAVRRHGHHRQV